MKKRAQITIKKVNRPHPMGHDEEWIDVLYQGEHLGWLPVGTPRKQAVEMGRRWLGETAAIRLAARDADDHVAYGNTRYLRSIRWGYGLMRKFNLKEMSTGAIYIHDVTYGGISRRIDSKDEAISICNRMAQEGELFWQGENICSLKNGGPLPTIPKVNPGECHVS